MIEISEKSNFIIAPTQVRFMAALIDLSIVLMFFFTSTICYMFTNNRLVLLLLCLPILIYKPLTEAIFGCTLGKLIFRLRVVDSNAQHLTINQSFIRFIPFLLVLFVKIIYFAQFDMSEMFGNYDPSPKGLDEMIEQNQQLDYNPTIEFFRFAAIILLWIDAMVMAVSGRAIHDYLAKSYCIQLKNSRQRLKPIIINNQNQNS